MKPLLLMSLLTFFLVGACSRSADVDEEIRTDDSTIQREEEYDPNFIEEDNLEIQRGTEYDQRRIK